MSKKIEIGPYSAYAIAVKHGYVGTEEQWINAVEAARKNAESSASTAKEQADKATEQADTATEQATTATTKAGEAAASATQADASQKKAAENQQAAEDAANRAAAIVSTDKTLSVDGAPADAKASGEALSNRYTKDETNELLTKKLDLTGGTMTGRITRNANASALYIHGRNNVVVYGEKPASNGYSAVAGVGTTNGAWTIGAVDNSEDLLFVYTTNDNYDTGNNQFVIGSLPAQSGTIITTATIGSQSVDNATKWNGRIIRNNHNTDNEWIPVWGDDGASLDYVLKKEIANLNGVAASGSNYVRLTDGTQICWGDVRLVNSDDQDVYYTITLPQAFASDQYCVTLGMHWAVEYREQLMTTDRTATTITFRIVNTASNEHSFYWMAIGRWK